MIQLFVLLFRSLSVLFRSLSSIVAAGAVLASVPARFARPY